MDNNFHSRIITSKSTIRREIKQLFATSFKKQKIIPLWYLLLRAKKPNIDFLALYDDDKFVGLTYLIHHESMTFIFYLAINNKYRSKGYGSEALNLIKSLRKDPKIFLNIDNIDSKAKDYQQRIKRKQFYINNGFSDAKYPVMIAGEHYETMSYNCKVTINDNLNCWKYLIPIFYYSSKFWILIKFFKFG